MSDRAPEPDGTPQPDPSADECGVEPAERADSPEPAEPGEPGPADDRESAYGLFQRGAELSAGRHYAQAAIVLERAERLEPGKGSILELLGRAYFMSRQWEGAAATFERLLEVDPSAHYAHYALGQTLKHLGKLPSARLHLRLAVALSPASRLYRDALRRISPDEADQA